MEKIKHKVYKLRFIDLQLGEEECFILDELPEQGRTVEESAWEEEG